MGKNIDHQRPAKPRGVCSLGAKDIALLNERRIALTELTIKNLQVRTSSPWPAPCTSSTRCWRKGDEA
jgi:hypothetical protein